MGTLRNGDMAGWRRRGMGMLQITFPALAAAVGCPPILFSGPLGFQLVLPTQTAGILGNAAQLPPHRCPHFTRHSRTVLHFVPVTPSAEGPSILPIPWGYDQTHPQLTSPCPHHLHILQHEPHRGPHSRCSFPYPKPLPPTAPTLPNPAASASPALAVPATGGHTAAHIGHPPRALCSSSPRLVFLLSVSPLKPQRAEMSGTEQGHRAASALSSHPGKAAHPSRANRRH